MNHIQDLRNFLLQQLVGVSKGQVDTEQAFAACNLAGKILYCAKIELEYRIVENTIQKIPFLDSNSPNVSLQILEHSPPAKVMSARKKPSK